ncbi:DUF4238 domain-containing protein [Streptomyces griseorubiginosus]|uniref:DUF4238 domain-containing protein n=2 Tax=Streptomyces griseorubiginosus TaxID=67304 RepID=UPI00340BFDD3
MKAAQIRRQHLVSKVLLKQFTEASSEGSGLQLRPVDVRNPERRTKLASPRTCGWADTFVAFDSASAEKLWDSVETRAHAAFEAVRAGTPFADPVHAEALRDLVVLHYVRSYRYRSVYTNAFESVSGKLRGQLVRQYPEQLRREALRQTRLHLDSPGSLGAFAERLIEQSEVAQEFESGKLFRTSIEGMFHKVRAEAAKWRLEVLTPESGQFLVGDNPGVSVRTDAKPLTYNIAFKDAHSIVLPISPRHLLALGRDDLVGTIPRATVNDLNTVQIRAANQYVYMHPRSTRLETFARDTARRWRTDSADD